MDGQVAPGELGQAGRSVYLYRDDGDGVFSTDLNADGFISQDEIDAGDVLVAETLTAYNDDDFTVWGKYQFDDVLPGNYWVWHNNGESMLIETTDNPHDLITLHSFEIVPDVNFGIVAYE
jgi:hypothetical protein